MDIIKLALHEYHWFGNWSFVFFHVHFNFIYMYFQHFIIIYYYYHNYFFNYFFVNSIPHSFTFLICCGGPSFPFTMRTLHSSFCTVESAFPLFGRPNKDPTDYNLGQCCLRQISNNPYIPDLGRLFDLHPTGKIVILFL